MEKRVSFSTNLRNLLPLNSPGTSEAGNSSDVGKETSSPEEGSPLQESKSSSETELQSSLSEEPKPGKDIDEHRRMIQSQEHLLRKVIRTEGDQRRTSLLRPCDSCELLDPYHTVETGCCWGLCPQYYIKRTTPIHEFWLVSSPGDREPFVTFEKLKEATDSKKLSLNYKFHIPPLRTGNLNQLLNLMDAFAKVDVEIEKLIKKLANFMYAVLDEVEDVSEYFDVYNLDIPTYITRFTWNAAKYPYKKPLPVLYGRVKDMVDSTNAQLLRRLKEFNELDRDLEKVHRQLTGTLKTKSLHGIVKESDVIRDSKFLTSVLVVVDLTSVKEWTMTYESLCEMVVPQSSVEITRDEKYALFAVAVSRRHVDVFVRNASAKNFTVRDFEFVDGRSDEEKDLQKKLHNLRRAQIAVLYRWIKCTFSDCFSTWMHIKAFRLYIESVLRYGLPADFHFMLLMPLKPDKLREELRKLFSSLDTKLTSGFMEDIPGGLASYQVAEYFPYVFLRIQIGLFAEHRHT